MSATVCLYPLAMSAETIPKVQVRDIPRDLWRAVRIAAARQGVPIREFVIAALRYHLQRQGGAE